MGFFGFLKGCGNEKKEIRYKLDPQSIKTHNLIMGQANQIAELQAELARFKSRESEERKLQENRESEEQIKSHLQKEKKQLSKQDKKYFSLKAFFAMYFKSKEFREKLRITTFDRSKNISKFGDFAFSGNQLVLLDDKGKILLSTRELKDMFQSVGALANDISSYKIPINLDKDGRWIENIMIWESPEIIQEEEGFRYSKARKRPLYELLGEKANQIQEIQAELEASEVTILEQQNRLNELELSNKTNEKSGEIARAERVKTAETVSNIEKIWRDTETELTKMRQISVLQEDEITQIQTELKKLRQKCQDEGVTQTVDEVVSRMDKIKDMFRQRTLAQTQNPEVNTQVSK